MGDPRPQAVQRRDKLRPRPLGMGGAMLALVVAVVIFIGLVLWYTVNPAEIEPSRLSDLEVVHGLTVACHDRYPQGAKPAGDHLAEAFPQLERARFEEQSPDWATLEVLFCRALAVEPDNADALLGWVEVVALRGLRGEAEPVELERAAQLLGALHRLAEGTEGLPRVERELLRARRGEAPPPPRHGLTEADAG